MRYRNLFMLLILVVAGIAIIPAGVRAFSVSVSVTPGCSAMTSSGTINWTRDTTGANSEAVNMVVTDGAGKVLLDVTDTRPVGTLAAFGLSYTWTSTPQYNPITIMMVSPAGNGLPEQRQLLGVGECPGLPYAGSGIEGPEAYNLYDGRLNNNQKKDVAAPVAVYCTAQDTLAIFKIDAETGAGTQVINQPFATETPADNQLLASADGVSLYLLATGEYQINAPNFEGKLYSIAWTGCDFGTLVHLGA